ncbi:MAG: glycogen synthase GlgA [Thermoanaerobaculum sp.]|nr:glycogen synthase GlgA [Thermoanaerobaculum sp.]
MRVVHVVSEAVPFSKTGGLADVAGALPKAQAELGAEVAVVLPAHRSTLATPVPGQPVGQVTVMGLRGQVHQLQQDSVRWLFLDVPPLFVRPGLYSLPEGDFPDNPMRFVAFVRAALSLLANADVVHAHDWQAALVPFLLRVEGQPSPHRPPVSVLTVHNLAYQGVFPPWVLDACQLPREFFTMDYLEFYGQVNFLKAGLATANAITTVSPTYAKEILTPHFGCALEGVLRSRQSHLFGILNGLDQEVWDPRHDTALPMPYSPDNLREGKEAAAAELRRRLGLSPSSRPILGMVSRLTEQKGADVVVAAVEAILALGFDLVILGTGEAKFEELLAAAQAAHPDRVAVALRFDDELARLIYGGSTLFLMPSRWEPCGLGQMIAMRYGTLPVVHATGGLADTVFDVSMPEGNGFPFAPLTPEALVATLAKAQQFLAQGERVRDVQRRAMEQDFSWRTSAKQYLQLYQQLRDGGLGSHG